MIGAINYGRPVNEACGLNHGLVSWWLSLPHNCGGRQFFDLCGRNHGTLDTTYMVAPAGYWVANTRAGSLGARVLSVAGPASSNTVALPFVDSLKPTAAITLCCWARFNTIASNHCLMHCGIGSSQGWALWPRFSSSGVLIGMIADGTGDYFSNLQWASSNFTAGIWYHLAMTFNGLVGRLYVNAVEVDSYTKTTAITYSTVTTAELGSREAFAECLDGQMDDARIYGRWLSGDQIAGIYQDSLDGYPLTLNRYTRKFAKASAAVTARPRHLLTLGCGA